MMNKTKTQLILKLEEKYCYRCKYFYEGFICGFEISADNKDEMQDILNRRKGICSLDEEPLEVRKLIYNNL